MTKVIKVIALGSLLAASSLYAVSTAACAGCHGQHFEKKAMGVSKIVKDMSKADIIVALKGYKNGTYGGSMKGIMKGQVANLSDEDIKAMADLIKSGSGVTTDKATEHAAAAAVSGAGLASDTLLHFLIVAAGDLKAGNDIDPLQIEFI